MSQRLVVLLYGVRGGGERKEMLYTGRGGVAGRDRGSDGVAA